MDPLGEQDSQEKEVTSADNPRVVAAAAAAVIEEEQFGSIGSGVLYHQFKLAPQEYDVEELQRELTEVLSSLGELQEYFTVVPERVGQSFEHMKAVLDRRYKAMLKSFANVQQKIKELSLRLRAMESKLAGNPLLRGLLAECTIYSQFSQVLENDLRRLTKLIQVNEARLSNVNTLYHSKKVTLNDLNERNLVLSTLITRAQRRFKEMKREQDPNARQPFSFYYLQNNPESKGSEIEKLERMCGVTRSKTSKGMARSQMIPWKEGYDDRNGVATNRPYGTAVNSPRTMREGVEPLASGKSSKAQTFRRTEEGGFSGMPPPSTAGTVTTSLRRKPIAQIQISGNTTTSSFFESNRGGGTAKQGIRQIHFTPNVFFKYNTPQQQQQQVEGRGEHKKFQELQMSERGGGYGSSADTLEVKEVKRQIEQVAAANEKMRAELVTKSNSHVYSLNLLKEVFANYRTHLESNQRIVGSKDGLAGSLLFKIQKLNKVESVSAGGLLNAMKKQNMAPSKFMDRESRILVHDTLKGMVKRSGQQQSQLNRVAEENRMVDMKLFQNLTPIQMIGLMCLHPHSFDDILFIMERKGNAIHSKMLDVQGGIKKEL